MPDGGKGRELDMYNLKDRMWGIAALAAVTLSACTQPLSDEQTKALQTSADQIAASLSLSATLQQDAHEAAFVTSNLCQYLAGRGGYGVGALPPALDIGPTARDRLALSRSLKGYLSALIDASRGASLANLETARDDFVTQAAALTQTPTTVEPVLAATFGLLTRLAEGERQRAIRAIMDGVADDISTLPVLLAGDQAAVLADVEAQIDRNEQAARCVLQVRRSDPAAAEVFTTYDTEIRALRAQTALIKAAPGLVRRLRQTHIEIVDEAVSFADGLGQLVDVLEDINTLISSTN